MVLKNNPIKLVIMQYVFANPINIKDILIYDSIIKTFLKQRRDNLNTNIELSGGLNIGINKFQGNTEVLSYTYESEDKKFQFHIETNQITFVRNGDYESFEVFRDSCFDILKNVTLFDEVGMKRVSLRYVNSIKLPKDIQNIQDYINQTIASNENAILNYPILNFSFRFSMGIENNLFSIINHSFERTSNEDNTYILDIDVINIEDFSFSIDLVNEKLLRLREIKNKLFFNTITNKTIELCS